VTVPAGRSGHSDRRVCVQNGQSKASARPASNRIQQPFIQPTRIDGKDLGRDRLYVVCCGRSGLPSSPACADEEPYGVR
jgi:hypothetical protein